MRKVQKVLKNPSKPTRKLAITNHQTIDIFEGVDHKQIKEYSSMPFFCLTMTWGDILLTPKFAH